MGTINELLEETEGYLLEYCFDNKKRTTTVGLQFKNIMIDFANDYIEMQKTPDQLIIDVLIKIHCGKCSHDLGRGWCETGEASECLTGEVDYFEYKEEGS